MLKNKKVTIIASIKQLEIQVNWFNHFYRQICLYVCVTEVHHCLACKKIDKSNKFTVYLNPLNYMFISLVIN